MSSKDYARQVTRREPLKEVQVEELRLVPDDQWYSAQARLAREAARVAGRKPRDGDTASRPRALNGLFWCPTHDRALSVGGVHGRYMTCTDCRGVAAGRRPLYSQLPRGLALQKTCAVLADRLRGDAGLVERVVTGCQEEAARVQQPDPRHTADLAAAVACLDRRIGFVLRNPGDTDADEVEAAAELRRLRRERAAAQAELTAAGAATRSVVAPTEAEVRGLVDGMVEVLVGAAGAGGADAGLVRELIDRLTGGRIELVQAGERRAKGGWLRGRFRCDALQAVTDRLGGQPRVDEEATWVEVDYRTTPDPEVTNRVAELFAGGRLVKQIAAEVGLSRGAVGAILDAVFAERGEARPDGRTRRSTLADKHVAPPPYRRVADR